MKNIRIISVVIVAILAITSCKREEGPETVMRKFANHFSAGEYEKAAAYGTESTKQLLTMMESLASVGFHLAEDENRIVYTDKDITCTMGEDNLTAVCSYLEFGEMVEVTLRRVDGKWLVDIPLDDLFYDDDDWYEDDEDDWFFDGSEAQLD